MSGSRHEVSATVFFGDSMNRRFNRLAAACVVALLASSGTATSEPDLYAPRSDWTTPSGGNLNISGFVFRDRDRDGVYDLEDPPVEGIATRMKSPNGKEALRWTNFNGFANFSMSAEDPSADITQPGLYDFEVIVPGGWQLTTGNAVQTKNFERASGAVSDTRGTPPFFPVGIAPILTISGTVPPGAGEDRRVSVRSPSGEWQEMGRGGISQFLIPAHPGDWQVATGSDSEGRSVARRVTVGEFPVQLSVSGTGGEAPSGKSVVVDFEDITDRTIREMPNGVGGLRWWNMIAYIAGQPAYNNNAVSGSYVGYNSSGHPARIWSTKPFSFVGGNFGAAWKRSHGETLRLRGWRRGELIYEDTITLSYLGPIWFQADYRSIDRLDLATEHFWQFVADDLSFVVAEQEPAK